MPPSPFTLCTLHSFAYYALIPSTQATTKSKFCATAHVEYTQGWSTAITATATIKVCDCGRCGSNTFRESTEQHILIVIGANNDTSCTRPLIRTCATTAETRTRSEYGIAGSHHCRNFFAKPDADLNVEPVSFVDLCIRTTARRFVWLTPGIRSRVAS